MNHFRILPTDPRINNLSDDQIELLFFSFISSPTDNEYKLWYRKKEQARVAVDDLPIEDLKKMDYTDEDIENISNALMKKADQLV